MLNVSSKLPDPLLPAHDALFGLSQGGIGYRIALGLAVHGGAKKEPGVVSIRLHSALKASELGFGVRDCGLDRFSNRVQPSRVRVGIAPLGSETAEHETPPAIWLRIVPQARRARKADGTGA
jgi:hypothetical protein